MCHRRAFRVVHCASPFNVDAFSGDMFRRRVTCAVWKSDGEVIGSAHAHVYMLLGTRSDFCPYVRSRFIVATAIKHLRYDKRGNASSITQITVYAHPGLRYYDYHFHYFILMS
jgi:hypothetical protein